MPRTKAQRSASARKAARTRKRNAATASKTTTTRRRRPAAKKGFLADLFTPAAARSGATTLTQGAIGGFSGYYLAKILPATFQPWQKSAVLFGASYLTSTLLKKPQVAAGMAGMAGAELAMQLDSGMSESGFDGWTDPIYEMPPMLNDYAPFADEYSLADEFSLSDEYSLSDDGLNFVNTPNFPRTGYSPSYYGGRSNF